MKRLTVNDCRSDKGNHGTHLDLGPLSAGCTCATLGISSQSTAVRQQVTEVGEAEEIVKKDLLWTSFSSVGTGNRTKKRQAMSRRLGE